MRPMTETRKRRLSDQQLLANKRLTNGCKTDHVTTRSQAKNDTSSRVSPPRKVKHKTLSTEQRRLMISMRLRHEEKHTTQASQNSHEESIRKFPKSSSRLFSVNGRTNGLSSVTFNSARSKLRAAKVLSSINDHQHNFIRNSAEVEKRAVDAANRETRAKKRRSALWVLNCEAEEFLFGETAAEDQEVELPPIASPPRKRRRMRATELGELLKETPLLESKLRNPPASSESEESTNSYGSRKKRKEKKSRMKTSNRVNRKLELETDVSKGNRVVEELGFKSSPSLDVDYPDLNYALMLEAACPSAPAPTQSQSVRIQRILDSVELNFSFERVPSSEVWFRTFSHQDRPRNAFVSPTDSTVVLPYEAKGMGKGSQKRIRKPPRKSPRCHASTQAILSSLKPTRSGRANAPTTSPIPSPTLPSSKSIPMTRLQEMPLSSTSSTLAFSLVSHSRLMANRPNSACMELIPSLQSPTLMAPNGIQAVTNACELTATQYLWDSIQFLSDPYVINVLSLAERSRKGGTRSPILTKILASNSPLLEKSSRRNNVKTPVKVLIPSPKTSPRLAATTILSPQKQQNGSFSKVDEVELSRSSVAAKTLVSPTSSNVRKSSRKSLVVSPEHQVPLNAKNQQLTSKLKLSGSLAVTPKVSPSLSPLLLVEEEVLFTMPSDSLPDFPWESFT